MTLPTLTSAATLDAALAAADSPYDGLVLVTDDPGGAGHPALDPALRAAARLDASFGRAPCLVAAPAAPGGRVIVAGTGPLDRDHDDVRRYRDAAQAAMARAVQAGLRAPLLVARGGGADERYAQRDAVAALGALAAMYRPLEAREARGEAAEEPVTTLGVVAPAATVRLVEAIEAGRRLARDVGGTEPERMAPPRFARAIHAAFEDTEVEVETISDRERLDAEYPLLMAVARASVFVERHHPRVVRLAYTGPGATTRTLLLAGKGVTYDTGGADLKVNGAMAGMSRDKLGAAAAAGLVLTASRLRIPGLKVVAELGLVRNSIGAESFVADEIVTGHSGCRVRIGNTDAEGRLVLADVLSHLREVALDSVAPHLFSVATLTGHAFRAVGPYTIALDNGPARAVDLAPRLMAAGDAWAEPVEVSRLRPEDFDFVRPRTPAEDVLSSNREPTSVTARGHQFPMAFLTLAAGLDPHGTRAQVPLPYTHLDIGGSGCEGGDWQFGRPTASPLVAMTAALLLG